MQTFQKTITDGDLQLFGTRITTLYQYDKWMEIRENRNYVGMIYKG